MMRLGLIFANCLAPIGLLVLWLQGYFWIGLLVLFGVHMLTLVATLVPACAWWGEVVTRIDGGENAVWLTIDDGPDPEDTPIILQLLESAGATATFFVIGEKAQRWPELIASMIAAGHQVENHTMTHPQYAFWRYGRSGVQREIESAQTAIAGVSGIEPTLFRAPAGMRNWWVHPALNRLGLTLVGWSVRGRDGTSTDRDAIVERVVCGLEAGAVILMHEGKRDAEGKSVVKDTLPRVLEAISARGLRPTVPQNLLKSAQIEENQKRL